MVKKKNFNILGIFFAVIVLVLSVYFVLAATSPTNLIFEQNTTPNYDKEGIFTVNWTTGGTGDFNYTIYTYADDVFYTSAKNNSVTGYSFSNITEANYTFTIEAENSTGKANSTNISIVVDTTNPAISYNSNTETNNGGANRTYIFVNVTASDTNNDSLVFSLYNSTTLVFENITTYTTTTINWTGLPKNETYSFNVTANDSATNNVSTSTRTFDLDGTDPTISSFTLSDTSPNTGDSVTSTCTATDNLDTSVSTSVTGISTSSTGTKTATCTATDNAGNSITSDVSYTVSSSSNDGNGGVSFWTNTYVVSDGQFEQGYTKELSKKYRMKIKINNTYHYVGVVELTDTTATINVTSNPQQKILSVGEEWKVEVTGDNVYDLSVTLNGITSDKANLSIVFISEEIPAETEEEVSEGAIIGEEGVSGEEEKRKGKAWLWIIGALVIIGAIVFFFKQKKAKRFGTYGF